MKFTERIALEQFNYVEVEAESFNDLVRAVEHVKVAYAERLHKPSPEASSQASAPFGNTLPPKEASACKTCGSVMMYKEWKSKDGRLWKAYKCPNEDRNDKNNHKPIWVK